MSENTFYLGLTMAGAISAGAYTGGAFDFLMEALEAWEKRKTQLRDLGIAESDWDIPSHNVVIPVISGASAGGITGALGLIALGDADAPRMGPNNAVLATLPRLYQAWVEMPCFVSDRNGPALLNTDDIKKLKPKDSLTALLDTTILGEIADAVLRRPTQPHEPRPYLTKTVDLFLTHTNLRGVPYTVRFTTAQGTEDGYDMLCHGDRVHYVVNGIGSDTSFSSQWAGPERTRSIDTATMPAQPLQDPTDPDWMAFAQAALGTSAFPLALTARKIEGVTVEDYKMRQWPVRGTHEPSSGQGTLSAPPSFLLEPRFPGTLGDKPENAVNYVTVDGGMIDNEPFELARWTLMKNPPHGNERDPLLVDRAVLMIDPFPEPPAYDPSGKLDNALRKVITGLLPAFKNQARFKPDALAAALDQTVYSRFLIAPRRRSKPGGELEAAAIACGLLGGFGGFLDQRLRAHDYQLGRLNAYLFLKDTFALPLHDPQTATDQVILATSYSTRARRPQFQTTAPPASIVPGPFYQIIPLIDGLAQPEPPLWPQVERSIVDAMVDAAKARADAVFAQIKAGTGSRLMRWAAAVAWYFAEDKVAEFILWSVLQDLIARDQYSGSADQAWPGSSASVGGKAGDSHISLPGTSISMGVVQLVLSALADPAYDYRTAGRIAEQQVARDLHSHTVIDILNHPHLQTVIARGPDLKSGLPTYTLAERKPGWFKRLPGVRHVREYFSGNPVID